jgi:hypothetical protein
MHVLFELSLIIIQKIMERRRLQHQKIKQQQRFCVSQQDLSEAIARMKPILNDLGTQRHATHENLTNISSSSSIEALNNRSVSQLIKEFEARTNITPYASAQDLLPIVNDVVSNGAEFNCTHMFIRTMKTKGNSNDNGIINNNVCSPISHSINDDNQMVIVEIHQQRLTEDKEQEKKDEEIHQTLDNDRHKQNLLPSSFDSIENKNNNNHHHLHSIQMLTRSTDIDAAALTLGKRHEIRFDELVAKEAQLNNALADLLSISNEAEKFSSINSSPTCVIKNQGYQRVSNNKKNNPSRLSASIDLLNDLLETFDLPHEDYDNKQQKKNNNIDYHSPKDDDNHVKPINMFW